MTDDRKTGIGMFLVGLSLWMTGALHAWPILFFIGFVVALMGIAAVVLSYL